MSICSILLNRAVGVHLLFKLMQSLCRFKLPQGRDRSWEHMQDRLQYESPNMPGLLSQVSRSFLFVCFCLLFWCLFFVFFFKIITWVVTNSECLIKSWAADLGAAALLTFSMWSARDLCLSFCGNHQVKTNRRHPPEAHKDAIFQEW